MADEGFLGGLLGGIGDAAQGVGSGLAGLLGGGQSGGPSSSGFTPDEERRMMISTLGQLGATLLAAGQKQSPSQRAQYLAQLGGIGSGAQNDIYKSRQGALMSAQMQEKMREIEENKSLDQLFKDPEQLKALGLTPQQARALGREGLKQYAAKQFGKTPLERLSQEELLRIAGVTPPNVAPAPAAPTVAAPQIGEPPAGGMQPTGAPAVVPVPAIAPPGAAALPPQDQGQSMAERIARNPIIQLADPARAAQAATIAEKLREPGAVAEAQTLARARAEKQIGQPTVEFGLVNRREQTKTVTGIIDEAISRVGMSSAGLGGRALVSIPQTEAYALSKALESIKANIGFDELQKMRDASPTGGALGQVAVQEINYLQSVLGSLDQFQEPADLKKRLEQIKKILNSYQGIRENAYERDYGKKFDPTALTKEAEQIRQQAGQPAEAAAPVRITNKSEYDALPSKTIFIGPDGKRREKP
jgi:hypothetical protein